MRQANPWVELFRSRLNFHIDWDVTSGKFLVRNDRPLPGEQALYEFSAADPDKRAYASIAYLRSLNGDAHVLLVGGTTAAGTEAAAEFLLDPQRLKALLQRAGLVDGSIGEHGHQSARCAHSGSVRSAPQRFTGNFAVKPGWRGARVS